ncbi:class IIb bacteriocin, lactobin A/cerein 7B family [Nakamurella alba]|nr:class IIb bacteriocin, lactobin A/cerein 7B family [Nakamurella alba]
MILHDIQSRAATDRDFRTTLLADPKAVLSAEGVELPATTIVEVRETSPSKLVLTLPPAVPAVQPDSELSESDLEGTNGGVLPLFAAAGIASALWGAIIGVGASVATAGAYVGVKKLTD